MCALMNFIQSLDTKATKIQVDSRNWCWQLLAQTAKWSIKIDSLQWWHQSIISGITISSSKSRIKWQQKYYRFLSSIYNFVALSFKAYKQ